MVSDEVLFSCLKFKLTGSFYVNSRLVNDILKLDDGKEVQISKCPNGHGKIKSPLCCGKDMNCSI